MAVDIKKHFVGRKMKIEFDHGLVGDKQVVKNKTINKLKKTATDEKIYEVSDIIADLQTKNKMNVIVEDQNLIIDEGY